MKSYSDFKKQVLKNKELRRAYDALAPEFAIAEAIIRKRLEQGITQAELAKRIGTRQSAISRLESGNYNPSIGFLDKVAKALNLNLMISMN
jgi:ribosome-binding protein aMBF1 (putative translation factor)